jgi:hypothetical protein
LTHPHSANRQTAVRCAYRSARRWAGRAPPPAVEAQARALRRELLRHTPRDRRRSVLSPSGSGTGAQLCGRCEAQTPAENPRHGQGRANPTPLCEPLPLTSVGCKASLRGLATDHRNPPARRSTSAPRQENVGTPAMMYRPGELPTRAFACCCLLSRSGTLLAPACIVRLCVHGDVSVCQFIGVAVATPACPARRVGS